MSAGTPAKKNATFTFNVALRSATDSVSLQSNPTLAAGDVKVSTDNGAFANITTLPTVSPASGIQVLVTASASEMNGDDIGFAFVDQTSPKEWCDLYVWIKTSTRQTDDLAYPTVSGRSLDVSAGGEAGVDWANVGSPTTVVGLSGTTVKTATDVETDTADIQARLPAALVSGRIDASVGAMAANVLTATAINADAITAAKIADGAIDAATFAAAAITATVAPNLDAAISTRATPAQVNTEVLDVLNVDTFAEPAQGAPAATATLVTKIGFLYKAWRNRHTQTATQYSLYNDDAVTIDHKATVSDDATTFDRTEVATGP